MHSWVIGFQNNQQNICSPVAILQASAIAPRQEAQSIMNFGIVALFVFASASLGLLGCGGVDCVEVTKKSEEVAKKLNECTGGDIAKVAKCRCDTDYNKITKQGIDGDCWPEGTSDADKDQTKKDLEESEKSCQRQAIV